MNDAELLKALSRAKAQLKSRTPTETTKIYIQRAEVLESCYKQVNEFAQSHRWYAKEIIEFANQKERVQG